MKRRMPRLALVAALLCAGIGRVAPVYAAPILTPPATLAPGAHFRFVFVTDGATTATSSNITDYDNFVNTQAGGATYNGSTVTWQAIGSTPSVSAINHITGPQTDPVFLATGPEVATSTTTNSQGLWSGTLLHAINVDLTGMTPTDTMVWTGTGPGGTTDLGLGGIVNMQFPFSNLGTTTSSASAWIDQNFGTQSATHPLYGISSELVVPSSIPEPSSWLTLGIGLGVTTVIGWSRHRRAQRWQAAA
jgi:hypothetical protein